MPAKVLSLLVVPRAQRKKAPSSELGCGGDSLLALALCYLPATCLMERAKRAPEGEGAAEAPGHQHGQIALPTT